MHDSQDAMTAGRVQFVAAAVIVSTPIWMAVGWLHARYAAPVLASPEDQGATESICRILLVIGVLTALGSLSLRKSLETRLLGRSATLADKMRVILIAMSVAETAGIMGLVCALLTHQLTVPFILWGCSLGVSILHFPTRAWLEKGNGPPIA